MVVRHVLIFSFLNFCLIATLVSLSIHASIENLPIMVVRPSKIFNLLFLLAMGGVFVHFTPCEDFGEHQENDIDHGQKPAKISDEPNYKRTLTHVFWCARSSCGSLSRDSGVDLLIQVLRIGDFLVKIALNVNLVWNCKLRQTVIFGETNDVLVRLRWIRSNGQSPIVLKLIVVFPLLGCEGRRKVGPSCLFDRKAISGVVKVDTWNVTLIWDDQQSFVVQIGPNLSESLTTWLQKAMVFFDPDGLVHFGVMITPNLEKVVVEAL